MYTGFCNEQPCIDRLHCTYALPNVTICNPGRTNKLLTWGSICLASLTIHNTIICFPVGFYFICFIQENLIVKYIVDKTLHVFSHVYNYIKCFLYNE